MKINFDYSQRLEQITKQFEDKKNEIELEKKIFDWLQGFDISFDLEVKISSIIGGIVTIVLPDAFKDEDFHTLLSQCVKNWGRFEKGFNEYSGTFTWKCRCQGPLSEDGGNEMWIQIENAPKMNCKIFRVKEYREVEVFKSECKEEVV